MTGPRLPPADEIISDGEELERSGRFGSAAFRRYEWEVGYSTRGYRDLLLTYSGHISLEQGAREGPLDCTADLIDWRYEGRITERYLTEQRVATRTP